MVMPVVVVPVVAVVVAVRVVVPMVSVVRAVRHGIIWIVIIRAIERWSEPTEIAAEGGEEKLRPCRGSDGGCSGARKHECKYQLSHGYLHRLMDPPPEGEWRAGPRSRLRPRAWPARLACCRCPNQPPRRKFPCPKEPAAYAAAGKV